MSSITENPIRNGVDTGRNAYRQPNYRRLDLRLAMVKRGIRFVQGEVARVDPYRRRVTIAHGEVEGDMPYDFLIFALGGRPGLVPVEVLDLLVGEVAVFGAIGAVRREPHGPAVDVVEVGVAAAGEGAQQVQGRRRLAVPARPVQGRGGAGLAPGRASSSRRSKRTAVRASAWLANGAT